MLKEIGKYRGPLLSIVLSLCFIPGAGQVYAGKVKRGALWFLANYLLAAVCLFGFLQLVMSPRYSSIPLLVLFLLIFLASLLFQFFMARDAYRAAKAWNHEKAVQLTGFWPRLCLIIAGLLVLALSFILEPWPSKQLSRYIKESTVESFRMPSDSMAPALVTGDHFFVDKRIYKNSDPRRGDIVVFRFAALNDKVPYAKRIVGLPGERVEFKSGSIWINGAPLPETSFWRFDDPTETHRNLDAIVVPEGQYYVIGDNAATSVDSRSYGTIPREALIGKVFKIYWPVNRSGPIPMALPAHPEHMPTPSQGPIDTHNPPESGKANPQATEFLRLLRQQQKP